jgi:hypothetical protein
VSDRLALASATEAGLMVVLTGIILAALRYWPPGHSG